MLHSAPAQRSRSPINPMAPHFVPREATYLHDFGATPHAPLLLTSPRRGQRKSHRVRICAISGNAFRFKRPHIVELAPTHWQSRSIRRQSPPSLAFASSSPAIRSSYRARSAPSPARSSAPSTRRTSPTTSTTFFLQGGQCAALNRQLARNIARHRRSSRSSRAQKW